MSNEGRMDEELRRFLDWQAGQLDGSPNADEIAVRISRRSAPRINTFARIALAGAMVVAVAVAGVIIFGRPNVSGPGVGGPISTPTQGPEVTPSPAATPSSAPTPSPVPTTGALAPGTHFLVNPALAPGGNALCRGGCPDYRRIVFTLPDGWAISGGLVSKHLGQPDEMAFSAWAVDQVYADPCHWRTSALSPIDLANHSHDAKGAIIVAPEDGGLANQSLRGALPRRLTEVTLGGESALRIELTVPADLDISTCDKGEFRSWSEWNVARWRELPPVPRVRSTSCTWSMSIAGRW